MYNLNKYANLRDKIIFGKNYDEREYFGGCKRIRSLKLNTLKELISENFANPNDKQNFAPCIQEMLDFVEKYPKCTFHGYAISVRRDDYRISLEGIECKDKKTINSVEFLRDFVQTFRFADDFVCNEELAYCWYD